MKRNLENRSPYKNTRTYVFYRTSVIYFDNWCFSKELMSGLILYFKI